MGLFNNSNSKTQFLEIEELLKIVNEQFIIGADDLLLAKVKKTAKGGGIITWKQMMSQDNRYKFFVGNWNYIWIFGRRKIVYVLDNQENITYMLKSGWKWKKFYKSVIEAIIVEKSKRS